MKTQMIPLLLWGLISITTSSTQASPVYFSQTGHWYEAVRVPAGITWSESYTNAVSRGGYLCTITNDAENLFVASLVDSSFYSDASIHGDILGPWLGGLHHSFEPWQWVTGESFGFTKWYPNQPDGYGGSEQRLQFYAGASVGSTWGDHPGDPISGYSLPRGYIVEYDQMVPRLAIQPVGQGSVVVSWSPDLPGFILQENGGVDPLDWVNTASGTTNPITITIGPKAAFYRVMKP